MEKPSQNSNNRRSAPSDGRNDAGSPLWGIGIYLCLAAVLISLIFASCNGGAIYKDPDATTTPPAFGLADPTTSTSPEVSPASSAAPENSPAPEPSATVAPSASPAPQQ